MAKLPGRVYTTKAGGRGVMQDFSGGLPAESLSNLAHSLIHNIANLADHLKKWARKNEKDKNLVDDAIKSSFELQVLLDLSNNDKHGYPPRDGGHSGRAPRLLNPRRVMRLTTGAGKGSAVMMTLARDGQPVIRGSGSGKAIVSGEVVDGDGEPIGDLYDIAATGLADWEALLSEYGVGVNEASD